MCDEQDYWYGYRVTTAKPTCCESLSHHCMQLRPALHAQGCKMCYCTSETRHPLHEHSGSNLLHLLQSRCHCTACNCCRSASKRWGGLQGVHMGPGEDCHCCTGFSRCNSREPGWACHSTAGLHTCWTQSLSVCLPPCLLSLADLLTTIHSCFPTPDNLGQAGPAGCGLALHAEWTGHSVQLPGH